MTVDERNIARRLALALIPDTERALTSSPELLAAYREAYKLQIDDAELIGYGSLAWKIGKPGMSGTDVIRQIVDPSSGPLIPNLRKVISEEVWRQEKPAVLKELIIDRRRLGESNAVLILAGLIAARDMVAWNMLTPEERGRLIHATSDYRAARDVLVAYGLLPKDSRAAPLRPAPLQEYLDLLIMHSSYWRETIGEWREMPKIVAHYEAFSGDQKNFVDVGVMLFRMNLWFELLADVYGEDFAAKTKRRVLAKLSQAREAGLESFLERLQKYESFGRQQNSDAGPDLSIAAGFMDWYVPEGATEDEVVRLVHAMADIFNVERVASPAKFRFYLRYFVRDQKDRPQIGEKDIEELIDLYWLLGARAAQAENRTLFEDWIGTFQ